MSTMDHETGSMEHADSTVLAVCTPYLYRNNSFRITGLAVDASTRDVKRRLEELKASEKLGGGDEEHKHAFGLKPPPSGDSIREAAQRLQDPERRFVEEFFWFWPMSWGKSSTDVALTALKAGDKNAAAGLWSRDAAGSLVAKHNLAVLYQLIALDSELVAKRRDLSPVELSAIKKYWLNCFKWWDEILDNDDFWAMVRDRIRAIDDPRLTTGYGRRMRAVLPEAFDKINASLAIEFAESGKRALAELHIEYMKASNPGKDDVEKSLALVSSPLVTRLRHAVENAIKQAEASPRDGLTQAASLEEQAKGPLDVLQLFLGSSHPELSHVRDLVAEGLLECLFPYYKHSTDWDAGVPMVQRALAMADSDEAKVRLKKNLKAVQDNAARQRHVKPIEAKIASLDKLDGPAKKVQAFQKDIVPAVGRAKSALGEDSGVYHECCDAVAALLRGLSVDTFNKEDNLEEAVRLNELAIEYAVDADLLGKLFEDQETLQDLEGKANEGNLHLKIRNDEIRIDRKEVRYNAQTFAVSRIRAVKFGIFAQYTNGVKTSSSYLIDLSDGNQVINIECNRLLRNEQQAEADFRSIIDSLIHHVAGPLVGKLSSEIRAGKELAMGDIKVIKSGVIIPTGSLWWKKDEAVPWKDLEFNTANGQVTVWSGKNRSVSATLSLRDTWNAVFFEYIAKAVIRAD